MVIVSLMKLTERNFWFSICIPPLIYTPGKTKLLMCSLLSIFSQHTSCCPHFHTFPLLWPPLSALSFVGLPSCRLVYQTSCRCLSLCDPLPSVLMHIRFEGNTIYYYRKGNIIEPAATGATALHKDTLTHEDVLVGNNYYISCCRKRRRSVSAH